MHRIETTYNLIFEKRSRPLENAFAKSAHGKDQIYLASEFLRSRDWKQLDRIGKVYLKRFYGLWYVGKFKKGDLFETMALPVIDEDRSAGNWLAIIIAGRRSGLPFRAYAKEGSWDYWKRFDIRYKRQGTSGTLAVRGRRVVPCDKPRASGEAVASGDPLGLKACQSLSGSWGAKDPGVDGDHRERHPNLASDKASVEGWETRGSADIGVPLSRASQET